MVSLVRVARENEGATNADLKRTRRRASGEMVGYGAASAGTGIAGTTLAAAKITPKQSLPSVERTLNEWAGQSGSTASKVADKQAAPFTAKALRASTRQKPGTAYRKLADWSHRNPKKSLAAAVGLKGAGLATGIVAGYRRKEAEGISHLLGGGKANVRARERRAPSGKRSRMTNE